MPSTRWLQPRDRRLWCLGASIYLNTFNISGSVCRGKGHAFSPAGAKAQEEIDRLLNEATQQTELAKAIDMYT